jgi:hypothetical protein
MPTLTINAEVGIHADGASVHLFVDGKRLSRVGPFPDWEVAHKAATEIIADAHRRVLPFLEATMVEDLQKPEKE